MVYSLSHALQKDIFANEFGHESTLNQEDEEEDDQEDEDEGDEESEDEDEESDDEDSDSDEKPDNAQNAELRVFGRDKNGMYKNHDKYLMLRNKINEQEKTHEEMFENITKKLKETSFVGSEMQQGVSVMDPTRVPAVYTPPAWTTAQMHEWTNIQETDPANAACY